MTQETLTYGPWSFLSIICEILQWCIFCNMMPWYLSTRIRGNISEDCNLAHSFVYKSPPLVPVQAKSSPHLPILVLYIVLYSNNFSHKEMYLRPTLYLIWQLAASAAVFMPWLPIMSATLFTSCQYGHWHQLQTPFFTLWWSPVPTAHPSSYDKAVSSVYYRSITCNGSYWHLLSDFLMFLLQCHAVSKKMCPLWLVDSGALLSFYHNSQECKNMSHHLTWHKQHKKSWWA